MSSRKTNVFRLAVAVAATSVLTIPLVGIASAQADPPSAPISRLTEWANSDLTPNQWMLEATHAKDAWATSRGDDVKVAVIDTGVDARNSDVGPQLLDGYVATYSNSGKLSLTPVPAAKTRDKDGHGTHVSGIIGALDNNRGTTGIAPNVKIIPFNISKTLETSSDSPQAEWKSFANVLVKSIETASQRGAKVINLSLGGNSVEMSSRGRLSKPEQDLQNQMQRVCTAITHARQTGTLTVVASGNDGVEGEASSPGNCTDSFEVGAVSPNLTRSYWSSFDSTVSISAPGENILSTFPNVINGVNNYQPMSGTSMATPVVVGAAAVVASAHPNWTPSQIENQLTSTSQDLGKPGKDSEYGFGLVNVASAVGQITTPAIPTDSFAAQMRWGVNYSSEIQIYWNAPLTGNVTGYTITEYDTRTGVIKTYDLTADEVRLAHTVTGGVYVNIVAHRSILSDLDGGWISTPAVVTGGKDSAPTNVRSKLKKRHGSYFVTTNWTPSKLANTEAGISVVTCVEEEVDTSPSCIYHSPIKKNTGTTHSFTAKVPKRYRYTDITTYVSYYDGLEQYSNSGKSLVSARKALSITSVTKTNVSGVLKVVGHFNKSWKAKVHAKYGTLINLTARSSRGKIYTTNTNLSSNSYSNELFFTGWLRVPKGKTTVKAKVVNGKAYFSAPYYSSSKNNQDW